MLACATRGGVSVPLFLDDTAGDHRLLDDPADRAADDGTADSGLATERAPATDHDGDQHDGGEQDDDQENHAKGVPGGS